MAINDAQKFVEKMKEDHNFRDKVLLTSSLEDFSSFLHAEGLIFDKRELVGAMAECMQQLELEMHNG